MYKRQDLGDVFTAPQRPAESSLPKLTHVDLLPPESSCPVPFELDEDPAAPAFVKEQRIEFLLLQRPVNDPEAPWNLPPATVLQDVFDYVREECDHDQIMEVVMWSRVEKATGITSIMMSTVNISLMNKVRHAIRLYKKYSGFSLETYSKSQFVRKYGISMYIPKENAKLSPVRLLRSLFYRNPVLHTSKIRFLCKSVFESDPPFHAPGMRSRIGDAILLFDSPELAEKLRPFPEDHKFFLNHGFSVTLNGGIRGMTDGPNFDPNVTSNVMQGSTEEALRNARGRV